jgi:hypothetical protein
MRAQFEGGAGRRGVHMHAIAIACSLAVVPALASSASDAGAAEPPPMVYVNGKNLGATHVPVIAPGAILLESTLLGEGHCRVTLYAYLWNEHEHGAESNPVRGYGEVVGFGTSSCEFPHPTLEIEDPPDLRDATLSVEPPLEETTREAEVCAVELKRSLSECPNSSERRVGPVFNEVRRRTSSLPWKLELIRGSRGELTGVLAKVGLAELGEGGTAEGQSTRCYPREEIGGIPGKMARFAAVPGGCFEVSVIYPHLPLEVPFYGTQEIFLKNGFTNGLHPSKVEFVQAGRLFSSEEKLGEGELRGELRLIGAQNVELIQTR